MHAYAKNSQSTSLNEKKNIKFFDNLNENQFNYGELRTSFDHINKKICPYIYKFSLYI